MHPSLRHLQIFRLFSRVLNVTETARLLRISQPTVSQALKELEAQLGVSLIVRGSGPLKLTTGAELLLLTMDQVLENMQTLRDDAARLRGEHRSSVSIATVHPLTPSILPRAIVQLQQEQADCRINIEAHSSREVVRMVKDRVVEVGFTFLPVEQQDLIVRPLMSTEMICLVPPAHRLAGNAELTPVDLRNERIITFGEQVRQEFDVRLAFDSDADQPTVVTTNNSLVSSSLVRHNMGIAITLPFVLAQDGMDDIGVSVFRPEISRRLVAIYLQQPAMSPLSKRLIALVSDELRQFGKMLKARGIAVKVS